MRNRKSSIRRGASTRDRIIARIMVLILTVSMMPYQALAADTAKAKRVKSVEDIQTDYEVDNGTSQEEIGLPSSLSVVIETGEEPERSEETVQEDILWEGEYDGDSAGIYELEARFDDEDLVYEDMPVVSVTVREPEGEPEEEENLTEETNRVQDEDEADQSEDEDEADQTEKAEQTEITDQKDDKETEAVKDAEQNADLNDQKEETEEPSAKKAAGKGENGDAKETKAGETKAAISPEELAEQLYGENGTARTFTVTLKDDKHNTSPNDVTRAGNNIGYNINVSMQAAATHKYDGQNSEVMFSEWKNIRIYLKLPENVRFTEIKTQGVADHFTQIDAENNIWEIVLTRDHRDATNANSINLDINARVEGNGELPDGTVLGEAEVTFSADFDVRINEDWTTKTYSKTVTDTTDKITLSTPDEWILTKSPFDPPKNYTIDKSKDPATVTVHYLIKYGLNVNNVPADDENVYTRPGRVPYEDDIKLTDTPTLTLHNGTTLSEISMTVTPAGTGYVYKDGSSADEGGKQKAIPVQSGTETVLPYAVVGSNTKEVAENAPAYSEYNVDVVYPYDDFMVWYYENVSKDDAKSTAENEAKIKYQLLGQNTVKETQEGAETTVPGYIPPGNIKIEKYIVDYDSGLRNLYTASKGFVTGPATFEVYESDGTTPADLWYKDAADNNKYKKINGNTLTVDPSQAKSEKNGNEGWIDFYLDAGTYVIKETGRPAYTEAQGGDVKTITVNEDETVTAAFDNKEKLGEVKVHKTDDSNNTLPVPGSVFGLFRDRQHTQPVKDAAGNALTATTNNSGDASFKRLVPGTYYLWEISAPQGYIKSEEVKEVTVTANNTSDAAVQVTNHLNAKEISLLKQYSTVADPNNFKDVTDDYRKFANSFVLQRCSALDEAGTRWTEWEDVSTHSIDNKGGTTVKVAEYDSQNRKIKYRFMETIPSDYFDLDGNPGNGSNKAYSDEIIPADGTILDPQNKIVMKNRRGGFIELTKKKAELNVVSGAYTEAAGGDKEFRLYRVAAGTNIAEAVDTGTTDANGKLTFSGLVSADARGRIYTYYVVEQNPDTGYTWITDSKIRISGTQTDALSVGSFTAQSGGTLTPVTYNVKQEIRLGVIKKDMFSDSTELTGAKFEISDESGKKQTVTTKNSGAVYAKIDLGHVYAITETEVPAGYYKDAQPQSIDTRGWHVEMENGNYKIVKSDGTEVTEEDLVCTFADTPYQKIRLQKKVRGENETDAQAKKLSGVTFSVYVKENNVFVPVKDANGNTVTIKADGTSAVSLPEGEYYLHEDTKAEGVAYPDDLPDLYTGKGEYSGGKFYFGSYEVKKPAQSQDTMIDLDAIVNIYNKGDLIVAKKLFDKDNNELTGSALNGFSMDVYKADESGNPVGNAIKRAVTGQGVTVDGQAIFKDLPVYDENGNKIRYVVKEVYTGGQADIYYSVNMVSSEHPVLISGGTADAGYIENHQYMSVNVVKKYYNTREYELTGLKYELEGAEIALYKNNGDGTYTYLTSGVTDKNGQVSFGKLKFSADGFVAIEVSIPDRKEYKYMVPVEGDYLQKIDGSCPPTLTQAQVDTLSKAALTSATDPKYTGEIDNEIPWTQIHVTKYDEGKQTKLDGADFTLYKQVLPKGTDGGELAFDAANCTVVGQYTSGTWIHNDVAQTGEFQTDILENADNVVYWLVEDKAPAGYTIKDSENYVLFPNEGTNYTNNSNGGRSTKVYPGGLKKNTINYYDVENEKEIGPLELDNRAYIEFTKWMQEEETAGKQDLARSDFKLMPNATFELYAVNASDHNKVYLLDTITTGDENLVDGGPATGYGVSRALDAWQIFDEIERRFPDQREHIITFKSATDSGYDVDYPYVVGPDGKPIEDAQGNRTKIKGTFVLNAVLVEISGSSKYELDLHDHNLQITFIPSSLSLGNDKYAVADLEHSSAGFCDQAEGIRDDYTANASASVAIVDYLAKNNSVVLRHFGYDPGLAGYELLHEDLEELHSDNPSLFISKEVSFSLERYNESTGKWEYWSPTTNKKISSTESFKTDGNGYGFAEGLEPGEYRAVMTTPAAGYENFYPNIGFAFHFTVVVSDKTQVFTTYSPARPDVTIEKKDTNGNTVAAAATFSLKSKSGTTYNQSATTSGGTARFTVLPADTTFVLAETSAPNGFTNEYFVNLFKEQNPDYAALVDGSGYPLSYVTTSKPSGQSSIDGSKLHEKVIEDKDYKKGFSFSIPNVRNVNLKLIKSDLQKDPVKYLAGAEFALYYHAFDKTSGEYVVPAFDNTWFKIGTLTTAGDDGSVTKSGLKPGVYYAVETKAPDHYELNTVGKTIVMTGGLKLDIDESDQYTVNTGEAATGELEFKDLPKVKMIIDKEVDFGSVSARDYSFSFTLKDANGGEMPTETGKDKAAGTVKSDGSIEKTQAVFPDLTQGATYKLEENSAEGYLIKEVKVGGKTCTPEDGKYTIVVPEADADVSVTVTNTLLEGHVTILKYDGVTGEKLTGASFEVLKADGKTVVSKAEVIDNGDGSYTAVIPLEGEKGETYYIHEVKAPEIEGKKYTIDEENASIKVEDLKPGQDRKYKFNGPGSSDNEYALPNYEGIEVEIVKYGGLPEASELVKLKGARFQMYYKTSDGENWNTWHPAETTDEQGKAKFMILKGYDYAIAETNDVAHYVGLYGVYDGNSALTTATSSDGRTLYVLGHSFENDKTYTYTGYNIPFLKLIVEKEDFSGTVQNPNVEFHVYEVPNGTSETLTEAEIDRLKQAATAANTFIDGKTQNSTYTNEQYIRPGKTYLAVEDHAIDGEGPSYTTDDYSIIKDDSHVVYYKVFSIPEKNYEKEYKVTFVNNKGSVTRGLTKSVDKGSVDSLTIKEAELTYTLAPNTTNGYALDAFKLNDSGLTAEPSNATLAQEWYNITEVIVGQGRMDKYLKGADPAKDYDIFATVTFVGFDGTEYEETPVNVSEGNISVKPVSAGDKKIKSFYVEYSSPDLKTDTGYALGQNFKAGNTVVKATVFKQVKPEDGVVTAVKKIINNADVALTYTPSDSRGNKQEQKTLTAEDDAETIVDAAKAPKIKFSKTGPDQDVPVELGSSITYRLTVKNVTGEPLDFTDPIIVDLLPQGMVVNQDTKFVKVVDRPGTIADNPAVSTGYAGDSQYVNIVFDGTVGDGESITVELTATVTNAVTNYGTVMRNFAFTTSKEVGVATSDNATGAVIRDDDGLWASELVSIATALDCSSSRAQALKTALGEQGKYGYLADWHENNWVSDNQLVCVKAEYGPADGGVYRTDKVSVVVNDEDNADQRRMHYQLSINNLSPSKRTNLVVMDILPVVGDQRINNTDRGSEWQLYFDEMGPVTVNGQACPDYAVYYYSGDASELKADDIVTLITKAKTDCPDGWSTDKPAKATAFIVAFNYDPTNVVDTSDSRTVVLEGNKSVQIEYTALTDYREAEDLNKIVFTNAANDFNFGFSTFSPPSTADRAQANEPLGSNQVEVTIAPPLVKVGGDVWIDADDNGAQDDGDQSWYLNFAVVKQLVKDLETKIDISDQKHFEVTETRDGTITETGTGANYGIAHFEYEKLTAAKLKNNSTDYVNWNDGTSGKLVGKNPFTYFIEMIYRGSTFAKTKNTVTPRGSYVPGNIPVEDQKDDNFEGTGSDYRTEQFFLHQTKDVFDMTKDIGFNLKRKLELTKVSRVDGKPVQGAEFTIYGPFVHDTGKDQELTDDNKAGVLTTDAEGEAEKAGLQFFMEYVIVETKAVEGFGIEGAKAEGNIQKLDEGKWLLKVPGYNASIPENEEYVETVTVRDPKNIEVAVEKIWNDEEDAYSTRPLSIEVMLYTDEACTTEAKYANGNTVEKKTLDKDNSWKAKWTDLPRYKVEKDSEGNETETEILYYAKETLPEGKELKGYKVKIVRDKETTSGKQSLTITNTPETKGIKVQKVWAGELPSIDADERIVSVTFQVQRSVDPSDESSWENVVKKVKGVETDVTIMVSREDTEAKSLTGLPKNDPDGNAYSYRAVEVMMTVKDKDGVTHDIAISDGTIGGYKVTEIHSAQEDGSDESQEGEDEPSEDEEFDTSTITNTAVKGKLKPVKDWQDEGNRYGDRPLEIKVRIKAEGTEYFDYETVVVLNEDNNWGEDLDPIEVPVMDVYGNMITYVITEILDEDKDKEAELLKKYVPTFEIETEGVEAKVAGEGVTGSTEITDGKTTTDTYTNTHKPVRTSVTAKKIWNDQNNKSGERPKTIEFTLFETYVDGEGNEKTEAVTEDDTGAAVEPKEVTEGEDGTWTVSWSDLAVYKRGLVGSVITYTVKETKINGIDVKDYYGYEIDENGLEVTNTPVETGLDVTKEWDDDEAEIAASVTAVTFRIESSLDGSTWSEVKQNEKPITLTLERKPGEVFGKGSVEGLPAYDVNSKPYTYRAVEISITVDGKTVEVKDGKVGGYEVTEKHTPGSDESEEKAVARDLSEIKNTLIRGSLAVEKEWTDNNNADRVRPGEITITLKAEAAGKQIGGIADSTVLNEKNKWADDKTWKSVPVYDAAGNAITYTFTEPTSGDYKAYVSIGDEAEMEGSAAAVQIGDSKDAVKIKFRNELFMTNFSVEKRFEGDTFGISGAVKAVTVKLQRSTGDNWEDVKNPAEAGSYDLTPENNWKHTWEGLPKYDKDGNVYKYRAVEVSITTGNVVHKVTYGKDETSGTVTAYEYTSSTEDNTTVINNKVVMGSLEVTKVWKVQNDKRRPGSIKITLTTTLKGEEISLKGVKYEAALNKANDWTDKTTWAQVPVCDAEGNKITYVLTEPENARYNASYRIVYRGSAVDEGSGRMVSTEIYAGDSVEAIFTNTLIPPPPNRTGDDAPLAVLGAVLAAGIAGLGVVLYRRRRR
ncbi:MAG: Cna B-type domain-containing protein [Lachnospiraceae bacterium]|nr:Cna B-type domain-containing protein [Lachnospiraceae bacterium]